MGKCGKNKNVGNVGKRNVGNVGKKKTVGNIEFLSLKGKDRVIKRGIFLEVVEYQKVVFYYMQVFTSVIKFVRRLI